MKKNNINIHGVLLNISGYGILIRGKSGIGKSECAAELLNKGAQLVADDLVMIEKENQNIVQPKSTVECHNDHRIPMSIAPLCMKVGSVKFDNKEVVNLVSVEAFFYFKDNTILKITSDYGKYNNKTLDMYFYDNVNANYMGSTLNAQKAEFSNQNSNLTISENVKLEDKRGTMFADKLFFDIKKQTLNVTALENSSINANIKIK